MAGTLFKNPFFIFLFLSFVESDIKDQDQDIWKQLHLQGKLENVPRERYMQRRPEKTLSLYLRLTLTTYNN